MAEINLPQALNDLVINVLANLIFVIGEQVWRSSFRDEAESEDIHSILHDAVQGVFEEFEWTGGGIEEEIYLFLGSPEVETIIRRIYALHLSDRYDNNLDDLNREFISVLSMHTGFEGEELEANAEILFRALLEGCEQALDIAINQNMLSAHETRSAVRYKILLGQLSAIQRNLELLAQEPHLDISEINNYEGQFRKQVATRHRHIVPPTFDQVRKIPINELYVAPRFLKWGEEEHQQKVYSLQNLLKKAHRVVIIGDPGSGKSTLSTKLCYDISTHYEERIFAGKLVTPILIVLRDYGTEKKRNNCSIVQYIATIASSKYQLSTPAENLFEYLLLNERALVIFDGLDELLDTSYRREISADIETFCSLYPTAPVIVTSRKVGYERAPLDTEQFESYEFAPFNEPQIEEYVSKWFDVSTDLSDTERERKVEAFMEESRVAQDLRSNSLMLALMCNLYRGAGYIPENRPDLYEKCSTMLFERWDKGRNIKVSLPFKHHISPAMKALAYWIYSDEELQAGVTEDQLKNETKDYLLGRKFENDDEAYEAAEAFVEHCTGRAWVFTDTGTTEKGDRLFQFTHRTFLEYFTASHLVRINPTPEQLLEILLPHIEAREWDMVSQLAFQIQNRQVEGAGDQLLEGILERSKTVGAEIKWNLLDFGVRSLKFIIPSPRMIRTIVRDSIFWIVETEVGRMKLSDIERLVQSSWRVSSSRSARASLLLANLVSIAVENLSLLTDSISDILRELICGGNEIHVRLAEEIAYSLPIGIYVSAEYGGLSGSVNRELYDYWREVVGRLITECRERILQLAETYFSVCEHCFLLELVTVQEIIKWHEIEALWTQRSDYFHASSSAPIIYRLTLDILGNQEVSDQRKADLVFLSNYFKKEAAPWITYRQDADLFLTVWNIFDSDISVLEIDDRDLLFTVFCIFAVQLEMDAYEESDEEWERRLTRRLKRMAQSSSLGKLKQILQARYNEKYSSIVDDVLSICGFASSQASLIRAWALKEVDFVAT